MPMPQTTLSLIHSISIKPIRNLKKDWISLTDPDASIVRHKGGKPKLQYKTHRAVDSLHEVITAVEVTTGSVNEAHKMASLIDDHTANTLTKPDTVVADSKYGTIDNLLECY
jgi:hypothetical protein